MGKKEEKKVSIIIPTYKRPKKLLRAIESALKQSYRNIEIIVIDDNNPDTVYRIETEKEMGNYKNNPIIKYIKHSRNINGSAARNTGIRISTGEYIAFLDDDDEFLENKIECQVNRMERLDDSWGACYTAYKKIQNGVTQFSKEKREGMLLVEALMRSLYIGTTSNLLIRRSVIEDIKGFDESFERNQDLEFLVRILKKYKIAYVDECSLIKHEDTKIIKIAYKELQKIDKHYLMRFKGIIKKLPIKDQKRIFYMIALDSFRYSITRKNIVAGIKVLIEYKVNILIILRYFFYLLKRLITKKSYGFEI